MHDYKMLGRKFCDLMLHLSKYTCYRGFTIQRFKVKVVYLANEQWNTIHWIVLGLTETDKNARHLTILNHIWYIKKYLPISLYLLT